MVSCEVYGRPGYPGEFMLYVRKQKIYLCNYSCWGKWAINYLDIHPRDTNAEWVYILGHPVRDSAVTKGIKRISQTPAVQGALF